ncbi:MAG: hypothetical protein K6A39_00155 [Clostridiales bacterium]|nr:hypothetical protein [Clostridiales bacterium]
MSENGKILIIGGAAFDTSCVIAGDTVPGDSNPGSVLNSTGGVGCNIAKNTEKMGVPTAFMTVLGDDYLSAELRRDLQQNGIDCGKSLVLSGASVCRYVSILDSRGELQLAVSDFEALARADGDWIRKNSDYIAGFPTLVLDANLSSDVLRTAAETARGEIFCDGVSSVKAPKLREIIGRVHTLKVNRAELGAVSGKPAGSGREIRNAAEHLIGLGVQRVFVTKGTDGASLFTADGEQDVPAFPAEVKSVTGAGDAFAAALLYGTRKGFSGQDLLLLGTAASHIAMGSGSAVTDPMSEERLIMEYRSLMERL